MKTKIYLLTVAVMMLIAGLALGGCSTTSASAGAAGQARMADGASARSGAELWSENCSFCHNIRSPASFNDAQWEVATLHMRVRANLTGEEQRKILEFLKSAD